MSAGSPLPPNFAFPKFDATLGALYVGSGVATVLYGVSCLQTFIYLTAPRTASDRKWLKYFVIFLLSRRPPILKVTESMILYQLAGTAEQAVMMAAIYRFLVSDFLNPLQLATGGAGSAEVFIYVESLILACISVLIQFFFCWRIWIFSASSFGFKRRVAFTVIPVLLSLFSFGTSIDLAINGFNHRILTGNTPDFVQAYKLATASQVAYDVIVTALMTWSLQRARVGIKRTDNVLTLITLFTINTNLLSTIFSIVSLVTFLTLPHATVYGAIGFILGKTYYNSFLAVLNARDYLREKFDNRDRTSIAVYPDFAASPNHALSGESTTGRYELSTIDIPKPELVPKSILQV